MKLPRSLSGTELIKRLKKFDYQISRQQGSHIRISTQKNGEHNLTIPNHDPLKIGTLSSILAEIADHHHLTKSELIDELL